MDFSSYCDQCLWSDNCSAEDKMSAADGMCTYIAPLLNDRAAEDDFYQEVWCVLKKDYEDAWLEYQASHRQGE